MLLVEPKEFSTNAIIDFCDETFDSAPNGRDWKADAIVIMTKYDKNLEDSRTTNKANKFFSEYHELGIFPYVSITPTLDREDLQPDQLFLKRKDLLEGADSFEEEKFEGWISAHAKYREEDPENSKLSPEIASRIGFPAAKNKMREVMLLDTAARLPEVLKSIREELSKCRNEKEMLEGKRKYRNPDHLKRKVGDLLQRACKRVGDYLDGDLEAAVKFPESLMDLDDELDKEDESEWADRTLGTVASVEDEERWRDLIQDVIEKEGLPYPYWVYGEKKFIGGKQFQRAKELMKATMLGKAILYQIRQKCCCCRSYLIKFVIFVHRVISQCWRDERLRCFWSRLPSRRTSERKLGTCNAQYCEDNLQNCHASWYQLLHQARRGHLPQSISSSSQGYQ